MDWQYLAGFFDGEGNIYLQQGKSKGIQVTLHNTDYQILKEIRDFLHERGIKASLTKDKGKHRNGYSRKELWKLLITNQWDARKFFKNIMPMARVKREKISESLIFMKTFKRDTRKFNRTTIEEIIRRYLSGESMKTICKRFHCKYSKLRTILEDRGVFSYRHKPFSREENEFLKRNYHKMRAKEIALKLGRNLGVIYQRANQLHLYKRSRIHSTGLMRKGIKERKRLVKRRVG